MGNNGQARLYRYDVSAQDVLLVEGRAAVMLGEANAGISTRWLREARRSSARRFAANSRARPSRLAMPIFALRSCSG